jgi:hypothetical protein
MALEGLIVDVEARIDKLEKGLKKANVVQKRSATLMERRAAQSANRINASYAKSTAGISSSFKKLGPALLAGLSIAAVGAATNRIRSVVGEVARIGDAAATAGVNVEQFQELKYVSEQSRIDVDAMTDSLKELSLRADEFIITGKGPAAEAFNRLGFKANELKDKLKDPPKLLEEIADRAKDLDSASRIRIFDELLGGTGAEKLTRLLSGGGDALRNLRQEARETGAVLDADVIRKAEELDRRFQALTSRVSNFGKAFAVGLADASVKLVTLRTDLTDLTDTMERAESLLGDGVAVELSTDQGALDEHKQTVGQIIAEYHRLGESADQLTGPLFQAASNLAMLGEADASIELNRVATEMSELVGNLNDGSISAEEFENRVQDLTGAAQTALAEVAAIDGVQFTGVTSALAGFVTMMGVAIARARELRAALPNSNAGGIADPSAGNPDALDPRGDLWNPPARVVPPSPFAPNETTRPNLPSVDASFGSPEPASGGGGSAGGGLSRQSDLEREIESIAEETAALKLEAAALAEVTGAQLQNADAIELARTKAELLAAAQRSGVAVTPALKAKIDTLAEGYVNAGTAAELAAAKIQEVQDASKAGADSVASVFEGLATGALTAEQAVGQLIIQMLKMSLQKRMLEAAEGAGGSVFGGFLKLIGGGFAEGGYTGDGDKYEPAGVVHRGEYVLSKAATSAIGVGNLEALHRSAKRGYAEGGLVSAKTSGGAITAPNSAAPAANGAVNINAPITVNGSAGTPEQNTDLAGKMAKEIESTMRGVVVKEIQNQMRVGNMLNRRK